MLTLIKSTVIAVICLVTLLSTCKHTAHTKPVEGLTDSVKNWIDWVVAYKEGVPVKLRNNYIDSVKRQLAEVRSDDTIPYTDSASKPIAYNLSRLLQTELSGHPYQLKDIIVDFCNCPEPLLWNVRANLYYGKTDTTGESTTTPAKPKPGGVSGGLTDAADVNDTLEIHVPNGGVIDHSVRINFNTGYEVVPTLLAVVDTGIDTTLLAPSLRAQVLWNGASGPQNLLLSSGLNHYNDDHPIRHGTSVATLAMKAFYKESGSRFLPKLMVLKAADSTGHGNVFEYACAVSFALRNKADVINSSMGFYGDENEMVHYLMRRAKRDRVAVVAAAGNANGAHERPLCRIEVNSTTKLEPPRRMFYPAVLARDQEKYNVISVTGFSGVGTTCFFQNYSGDYVTLGVLNEAPQTNCCSYTIPFIRNDRDLEGSSFSTPIVSGRLAFRIRVHGRQQSVDDNLRILQNVERAPAGPAGMVTIENSFIRY